MSKNLFDLIKTLSKAEKRMFSENLKKTKRANYYKNLILTYSRSEEYSTELDEKIFINKSTKSIIDYKTSFKNLLYPYLVSL